MLSEPSGKNEQFLRRLSHCVVCVFAWLMNKASSQQTLEGVTGGSIVLPCSSNEHEHELEDVDVSWRHNGSKVVSDVIKGVDSVAHQDRRYKARVETFPGDYQRRNFSIRIKNLTRDDAGSYTCYITPSDEQNTLRVTVNESSRSINDGRRGTEATAVIVVESLHWGYVALSVVLICVALVAVAMGSYFVIRRRKTNQASSFSSVATGENAAIPK